MWRREAAREVTREQVAKMRLVDGEAMSYGIQASLEAEKGKELDSPLETLEGI